MIQFKFGLSLGLLSLLFVPQYVSAESGFNPGKFSPVRLDEAGGTMEGVPVRDQGGAGICFAEVAAEYVGAIQKKYKIPPPMSASALALAAGVGIENNYNSLEKGGDPCRALAYAKKNGVCSADSIENTNTDVVASAVQEIDQKIDTGESLNQDYQFLKPNDPSILSTGSCLPHETLINEVPDLALMKTLNNQACDIPATLKNITKNCTWKAPHPTMANPLEKVDLSCGYFPTGSQANLPVSPSEYAQRINKQLNSPNALPVMIGFCSKILTDDANQPGRASSDTCGPHAAMVIGSEIVDGRERFIVRNSWGTECNHYKPEYQKQCEEGRGNVSIDAETLGKNMKVMITTPGL